MRRSGAANDRRKRTRLRFLPIVRDERALHGCERALVADVEPQGFCFLGWQTRFGVALRRRDWRHLRLALSGLGLG